MIEGILTSDVHGGSKGGLLTPDWRPGKNHPEYPLQVLFWEWFEKEIKAIGPVDYLHHNGDATDGSLRPAMIDIAVTDVSLQAEIGADALSIVKRKETFATFGTPVHTVGLHDYERHFADRLGAEIGEETTLKLEGLNWHWRHTAPRSDTPYGQGTQLFKQKVRDSLEAEMQGYPKADAVVRSHVHYFLRYEMIGALAISTPCLQLPINRYGRKLNTQYYNVGFLHVRHHKGGFTDIYPHILQLAVLKPRRYKCLGQTKRRVRQSSK